MTLEQLVLWIIIGGIAGILADAVVRGIRVGLGGAIAVGILGAIIGGWVFRTLGISIGAGILGDIIVAGVHGTAGREQNAERQKLVSLWQHVQQAH